MVISSQIDINRNLTIYACTGAVTMDDVRNTIAQAYQGTPTLFTIWDFNEAKLSFTDPSEIRQLSRDIYEIVRSRDVGRTALVSENDFNFAIFRMYQAFAEADHYNAPIRVFRSIQEAEAWIFGEGTGAPAESADHRETER